MEAIKTIQDGMKEAFQLGKGSDNSNRIGEYFAYAMVVVTYLFAIAVFLWDPADNRFGPDLRQQAIGYIWSLPASLIAILSRKGK